MNFNKKVKNEFLVKEINETINHISLENCEKLPKIVSYSNPIEYGLCDNLVKIIVANRFTMEVSCRACLYAENMGLLIIIYSEEVQLIKFDSKCTIKYAKTLFISHKKFNSVSIIDETFILQTSQGKIVCIYKMIK